MNRMLKTCRPIFAGLIGLSLLVAPVCSVTASACTVSPAKGEHAGHARCCCGTTCHCVNCPGCRAQGGQGKNEFPANPAPDRDVVKIVNQLSEIPSSGAVAVQGYSAAPILGALSSDSQSLIFMHILLRV